MMKNMVIYLLAVNFITFLLYGDDFSSQNKKTEILYRYSADHAHRIWSGSLGLVYRWTFLSRL